jgi:hypothetical protein
MASLNPSTDISAYIQTIYEASILVARDNNVMTGLVRTFNDRTGLASRSNSQYNGLTVNSIAETDDLTGQAFTPSPISTLTPSEAGGQYFLTDSRVESDPFAVRNDASADMGGAMATKMETDLIGNFTSFTGGTVGAAGTAITWGHIFAMEARLRANKAPYPYYLCLHPYQWQPLAKAASVSGTASNAAASLLEEVNSMFFVRQVGGVLLFISANIPTISGDDAYVGMWSRDAMALDVRRQPRIEPQRDASRRGWELNLSTVYAHGVWRPTFGIQGLFDNSLPTS